MLMLPSADIYTIIPTRPPTPRGSDDIWHATGSASRKHAHAKARRSSPSKPQEARSEGLKGQMERECAPIAVSSSATSETVAAHGMSDTG